MMSWLDDTMVCMSQVIAALVPVDPPLSPWIKWLSIYVSVLKWLSIYQLGIVSIYDMIMCGGIIG